jgi:hypothetical protein
MEMRDLLIRCLMDEPFRTFIIRLEGGFELRVTHPEAIVYIPGVDEVVVFDAKGFADTFHAERIVTLRREGEPA